MHVCRSHRWLSWLLTVTMLVTTLATTPRAAFAIAGQSVSDLLIPPRGDAGQSGTMPGPGPTAEPQVLWEMPSDGNVIMGMAIRGNTLAFTTKAGSAGFIRAIDRTSGEESWNVEFGDEATVFGPAVTEDLFVVGAWMGGDGNAVIALDADTGEEVWRVEVNAYPTAPTSTDGVVYVAMEGGMSNDSAMVALDAGSGDELWRYDAPEALNLGERVAVADGVVVAAAWSLEDGGIGAYGFDAASGEVLWTFTDTDELTFDPVAGEGVVLLTDLPFIWGLDLETGEVLWSERIGDVGGGPALSGGVAYYGLQDEVRALDAATGEVLWTAEVTGIAGAPIVADGIVYTAAWRPADEREPHWIHALDAASGEPAWALELEHQVSGNQPLAVDGVLYVDADGAVVAFGSEGAVPADDPAAAEGGTYESEEFGYTIAWDAPWSLNERESRTDDGQDFTTFQSGQASVAIRTSALDLDAVEMLDAVIADRESAFDDLEVLGADGNAAFAAATMTFTQGGVTMMEYVEVTVIADGTLRLVLLDAPEMRFGFAFASARSAITMNGEPVFAGTPAT